jgi:dihydroorotase
VYYYNSTMHYDLILKNGTLVTPAASFFADIFVKNGIIIRVGPPEDDTADEVYDAQGKHILPGIIDAHVHFRDPGHTEREDFESGTIAAAFGGITMVADMPNVIPVTSTVDSFNEKVAIAKVKSYVDYGLFALLSNENTSEIEGLKKAGALGFKVFLGTSTGDIAPPAPGVMIEQMITCAEIGMRIGFHAETTELNAHFTSLCRKTGIEPDGLLLSNARPVISEVLAIQSAIIYSQYTKSKIHIHHVTSLDAAQLVFDARQKGMDITCETCPHYLLLDANTSAFKVYPPIRDALQRKGLWEALGGGIIDMIASDHAPHSVMDKSQTLWEAPSGLCGVETLVPLMLNEVNKGTLSLNDFVRLASEAPAKIWDIYPQKGNLLPGADADFTIVDMGKTNKIRKSEMHSKSRNYPYDGLEVQGIPAATIVRGKFIMRDGNLTGSKGFGSHISSAVNPAP